MTCVSYHVFAEVAIRLCYADPIRNPTRLGTDRLPGSARGAIIKVGSNESALVSYPLGPSGMTPLF